VLPSEYWTRGLEAGLTIDELSKLSKNAMKHREGFRSDHRQRRCLGAGRSHPHPHASARKSLRSNEIILSGTLIGLEAIST
jgi:hypothetical protein